MGGINTVVNHRGMLTIAETIEKIRTGARFPLTLT